MNIMVIAGYDVLADKIPVHRDFVKKSFLRGCKEKAFVIYLVGGATNPDYPDLTEADTNYKILRKESSKYDVALAVKVFPVGNTSAETLQVVKDHLEKEKISVNKLVLCTEQSRLAGFLLDALYVGLLDLSKEIVAYGHPFPDSKKDFYSQRRKMLMKVMSHYGFPLNVARRTYQWFHQRNVARIKRRQARASRS